MDRSCRPGAAFSGLETFRGQVRAEKMARGPDVFRFAAQENPAKRVSFYKALSSREKRKFEFRVMRFLQNHEISTAGTRINETDLVLVGASAVIPVFRFERWRYHGLDEIVVFGPSFDRNFADSGDEGRVVGLLGTGDFDRKMFLCRDALRQGVSQEEDGDNTAIHEFVHLVDKMDGQVDGIPKVIIRRQYVLPWLDLVKRQNRRNRERAIRYQPLCSHGQRGISRRYRRVLFRASR